MSENYAVTVTLNCEVPEEDIDVLIEMAGYGCNYWAKDILVGTNEIEVYFEGVEGDPTTVTKRSASKGELAMALADVADDGWFVSSYARMYFKEEDAGHIDSELADVVVQYALFGGIIYG